MGRVDGERGEDGEDVVGEELVDAGALPAREVVHRDLRDRLGVELGSDDVLEQLRVAGHELVRADADGVHDLQGHPAGHGRHGEAGVDAAFEAGDADHEELVEVGGEDREEADPLEQRHLRVGGEVEDALIEGEPAELAVEESVGGIGQVELLPDCDDVVHRSLLSAVGRGSRRVGHVRHRDVEAQSLVQA